MREKAENKPLMPSMLLSWLKIEAEERDWENRRGQKRLGGGGGDGGNGWFDSKQSRWGGIYQVTLTVSGTNVWRRMLIKGAQREVHHASMLILSEPAAPWPDGLPGLIMCMTMMSMFGCMLLAWWVSRDTHTFRNTGLFEPDKAEDTLIDLECLF